MAVVNVYETRLAQFLPSWCMNIQFDTKALLLTDQQIQKIEQILTQHGHKNPEQIDKSLWQSEEEVKAVFAQPVQGSGLESCRAVLTNSQYKDVIDYIREGHYFYYPFGNPKETDGVIAFSYGEAAHVNLLIAQKIYSTFYCPNRLGFKVKVYAQWEVADALWALCQKGHQMIRSFYSPLHRTAIASEFSHEQSKINLVRIDMNEMSNRDYLKTEEVIELCREQIKEQNLTLACQAWHAPRCYYECLNHDINITAGLFSDSFSPNDPQPWVHNALAWILKENSSWNRRKACWKRKPQ